MKTENPIFSHRISAPAPVIIDLLNRHFRTEIPEDAEISVDDGNVQFAWTTEPANPVSEQPDRREEWPEGIAPLEGFWYFGRGIVKRPGVYIDTSDDIACWNKGQWIIGAYGHGRPDDPIPYAIRKGSEIAKINGLE